MRDWDQSAIDKECIEALAFSPLCDIGMKSFARLHQWREDLERPRLGSSFDLFNDRRDVLFCDR